MKRTSKRNAAIIRQWNNGKTTQEIASELDISRSAVCGVLKRTRDSGVALLTVDGSEAGRRRHRTLRQRMGGEAYLASMRTKMAHANSFRVFAP